MRQRQRLSNLTFNYITETDATHHNQVNFTEYQNHTNLTYRCDPWSHSGGLQITNFSNSQLRSILKPLTDESQHKLQSQTTSLMLSKWYKYQATTMKLISFNIKIINHFSPAITSVPLQLALDFTKITIIKSPQQPP